MADRLRDAAQALFDYVDLFEGKGRFIDLTNELRAALAAQPEAPTGAAVDKWGVHMTHCNFGEERGCCKYGDDKCPAMTTDRWMSDLMQAGINAREGRDPLREMGELRDMQQAEVDRLIAAKQEAPTAPSAEPVALQSVELTRDVYGMCIVKVNGQEAIRDNGDVISHFATPDWFAADPSRLGSIPEGADDIVQTIDLALDRGYTPAEILDENSPIRDRLRAYAAPTVAAPAAPAQPASEPRNGVVRVERGFDFNAATFNHVPKLTVWFQPIPPDAAADHPSWGQRDALADWLMTAAPAAPQQLVRGETGFCGRNGGCICEKEGLGLQCIWLKPTDAELERRTGEPHIDGWPLYSGLPAGEAPWFNPRDIGRASLSIKEQLAIEQYAHDCMRLGILRGLSNKSAALAAGEPTDDVQTLKKRIEWLQGWGGAWKEIAIEARAPTQEPAGQVSDVAVNRAWDRFQAEMQNEEDDARDAARYRFIRDADKSDDLIPDLALYAMESLDDYIDAAMAEWAARATRGADKGEQP